MGGFFITVFQRFGKMPQPKSKAVQRFQSIRIWREIWDRWFGGTRSEIGLVRRRGNTNTLNDSYFRFQKIGIYTFKKRPAFEFWRYFGSRMGESKRPSGSQHHEWAYVRYFEKWFFPNRQLTESEMRWNFLSEKSWLWDPKICLQVGGWWRYPESPLRLDQKSWKIEWITIPQRVADSNGINGVPSLGQRWEPIKVLWSSFFPEYLIGWKKLGNLII